MVAVFFCKLVVDLVKDPSAATTPQNELDQRDL